MKKIITLMVVFFCFQFFLPAETIVKIEIEGNKKVSRDTILFYMKAKENGIFSEEVLRQDFKSLWDTGFFENIKIELENAQGGKVIKLIVKENPMISKIVYETGKKIKQNDIQEKLQENSIVLTTFSHYNPVKMKRVEKIIKEMLQEKGYNDGKVNITSQKEGENVALTINVVQGPKTRIGEIVFSGLDARLISPSFLKRGIKNNKPHGFFSSIGGKDVYNKEKVGEDLEEIKLKMQEKGYLEARVGTPTLSLFKKRNIFGKMRSMLRITVPVELGPQYRVGDINIEGNKILKTEFLKTLVTLKKGKIFNIEKRNKAIEEIRKIYGSLGYFYCQLTPQENLDPIKKRADLTINVIENEIVYLGKLEFVGNTFTKDHVIRREWFLREGKRLNINILEDSIRRMRQLGLVTVEKTPEIKPAPDDPQKINIKVEVQEMNRQMINFNVGYSGYDGWFIAAGYSTQNFLGMGETFTINLQSGTRAKTYRLAFTEPYLFNLPASLGVDLYKTSTEYEWLPKQYRQGFNLSTSARFWKYWGASLTYSYEDVEIRSVEDEQEFFIPYYYYYYYLDGKRTISSISPTLYYSTVDSPIFPSSGVKYLLNYRYSGGFLGGDFNLHKIRAEFVKFFPLNKKRHTLGFHAVYQYVTKFGDSFLPYYEKHFLGGERSIRGYDIYRLGPRDEEGRVIGGDKAFFLNFEYAIPLSQQFSFVFFYDIGNAYDVGQPITFNNVYSSLGAELKIFVPMLNVPFRLIFAYNPRTLYKDDSNFAFRFAVGPSFY
jgi:outer membrane protein insertion porin family